MTRAVVSFGLGAAIAAAACLLCLKLHTADRAGREDTSARPGINPRYRELLAASEPDPMRKALEALDDCTGPLGPIPVDLARKVFRFAKKHGDERDCSRVGHLAALSGDTELFRKMVRAYFGSAEGELKGEYVEKFLQYNPHLFFSLPDSWHLWRAAGGGPWCCDHPGITIPLIREYADRTADAERMLKDLEYHATAGEGAGSKWAAQVLKLLPRR